MRFATILSAFLGLAACVWAENITVIVAQNGTLTFTPSSVTANEGDILSFQFVAGNHTVTQSSFDSPCTRLTTPAPGIDSGFQPVSSNAATVPEWSFTLNTSSPLWFYCKQTHHCQSGMVFAVNPTANNTFDAFKNKATSTNTSSSTGPSSTTRTSSTGSVPSPSASNNSSAGHALGFNPSGLAGIITLVAILAGSVF